MARKNLDIFKNEKFMNSVFHSAMSNYARRLKERSTYVWAVDQDYLGDDISMETDVESLYEVSDSKTELKPMKRKGDKKVFVRRSPQKLGNDCEISGQSCVEFAPQISDSKCDILEMSNFETAVKINENSLDTHMVGKISTNGVSKVGDDDQEVLTEQNLKTNISKAYDDGQYIFDRFIPQTKIHSSKIPEEIETITHEISQENPVRKCYNDGQNFADGFLLRSSIYSDDILKVDEEKRPAAQQISSESACRKPSFEFKTTKLNDFPKDKLPERNNVQENFQAWCLRRQNNHSNSLQKSNTENHIKKNSLDESAQLVLDHCATFIHSNELTDSAKLQVQQSSLPNLGENASNSLDYSSKQISVGKVDSSGTFTDYKSTKKRNRHNSTSDRKHKVLAANQEHTRNHSEVRNVMDETMLSITISVEEGKYHETMTEYQDFIQLKKNYPKFSEVIPDIGSDAKEFSYSAEAIKAVLGLLLSPSYNFGVIQKETVAMEILAVIHSWEILKLQDIFHMHVVENILKKNNAKQVYSLAKHFGLQEITDACQKYVKDTTCFQHRQKKCFVKVSTYMEPLETNIPLYPAEQVLIESFNKSIQNDIIFESISGCFVITGIQISLNVNGATENNSSELKIYYSAENITKKLEIPQRKVQKSLGSKIFIYFNKDLIVEPKEKGRISIETDIQPCLCYTFIEEHVKQNISNGKFKLTLISNHRVNKSDRKAFFIGKLLYHVKSNV